MLETMYHAFCEHTQDRVTAWDRFIEFIATDHNPRLFRQLKHNFEWLFEDSRLVEKIEQTYSPGLLESDYYDHLGEMYQEHVSPKQKENSTVFTLMPDEVAHTIAQEVINKDKQPAYIIDPMAGTGRMLMAIHHCAPKAHLLGTEPDLRSFRIAYTNMAIHDIHALLLHADSRVHEIDLACEEGRSNWKYCNCWYSCTDKLKPITYSTLKLRNNGKK